MAGLPVTGRPVIFCTTKTGGTKMDDATRGRLFEEHDQLSARRSKLEAFILTPEFDQLPQYDRSDLRDQLTHMNAYERVLERRVLRHGRS
jgi:hypothetical protein